jgi:predicted 3-demethylubiquinone-9 3-methyltransferase (glyoxalase superfamily)
MNHQIYPCIWFDGRAKAAAVFYCAIFKDAKITSEDPMVVRWEMNGSQFMGLNGGPVFVPNEAISFVVACETQAEIDHYWHELTANGGKEGRCGWLKDKFGVSWQIVPTILPQLLANPEKAQNVVAAFMKMSKFDIETLLNA